MVRPTLPFRSLIRPVSGEGRGLDRANVLRRSDVPPRPRGGGLSESGGQGDADRRFWHFASEGVAEV